MNIIQVKEHYGEPDYISSSKKSLYFFDHNIRAVRPKRQSTTRKYVIQPLKIVDDKLNAFEYRTYQFEPIADHIHELYMEHTINRILLEGE